MSKVRNRLLPPIEIAKVLESIRRQKGTTTAQVIEDLKERGYTITRGRVLAIVTHLLQHGDVYTSGCAGKDNILVLHARPLLTEKYNDGIAWGVHQLLGMSVSNLLSEIASGKNGGRQGKGSSQEAADAVRHVLQDAGNEWLRAQRAA